MMKLKHRGVPAWVHFSCCCSSQTTGMSRIKTGAGFLHLHTQIYIYICMCMCMCIYINKKYPIYTSIYYVAGTALCASMSKSCTVSALGLSHFSQEVRELQGAERLLEFRMYRVEALGFIGLKAVEALGCRV